MSRAGEKAPFGLDRLLPPGTNAAYQGAQFAAALLLLNAVATLVPGLIHYGLPDGGSGVIAGIDLSARRETILAVFAWMGAAQIAFGTGQLLIAMRYRSLVPLFLALALVEQALAALAAWVIRPSVTGHHPPEHFGALVLVPTLAAGLWRSLQRHPTGWF